MRLSTFVLKKAGDVTQDSTDRKGARALEVDGWSIRLPALMLQLKLLQKNYMLRRNIKEECMPCSFTQILAPKVEKRNEKGRGEEKVFKERY